MTDGQTTIVWFRDDLRIADHPALAAAAAAACPVVCLYVLDDKRPRPLGRGARWWLAGSLGALNEGLRQRGNPLVLRRGSATEILPAVVAEAGAGAVYWNRRYDAAGSAVEKGRTGYPIVDAGMRQLWQTGWMHNRVRMIVASFLVKHLLLDWRAGEAWFWDTLVDADPANNAANWQ